MAASPRSRTRQALPRAQALPWAWALPRQLPWALPWVLALPLREISPSWAGRGSLVAAVAVLSIRSGQIARSLRSGLRMADFILPVYQRPSRASFIKGWQSDWPFYQGQPQWPFYQSRWPFYQSQPQSTAPLYQGRSITKKRPRGQIPISYCPAQAVYQRPSRAIFRKGWQSELQLYQGPPAAVAALSKLMAVFSSLSTLAASPRSRTRPAAAMAVLSICGWPISYCHV